MVATRTIIPIWPFPFETSKSYSSTLADNQRNAQEPSGYAIMDAVLLAEGPESETGSPRWRYTLDESDSMSDSEF